MHNKIFLVDGAIGVLGGRNIDEDYFGVDPELSFRDLDVLVVDPTAEQTGTAFDSYSTGATYHVVTFADARSQGDTWRPSYRPVAGNKRGV